MRERKATKVYVWNHDGRNDCGVLASSWKEAVSGTHSTLSHAKLYGSSFVVGDSWIAEWPYERGKPMYRPINQSGVPWRDTPYRLEYDRANRLSAGTWI